MKTVHISFCDRCDEISITYAYGKKHFCRQCYIIVVDEKFNGELEHDEQSQ